VITLDRLADRYAAIRAAQAALREFGARAPADPDGDWAELRNAPALFGGSWTRRRQTGYVPWPTDPRARMVWLASEQVQVWLPTAAEQNAAAAAWQAAASNRGARLPVFN
jgi:hypothetical protein